MKHQSRQTSHPDFNRKLTLSDLEDEFYKNQRFSHLQIFLSRTTRGTFGELYLMVSRTGFCIVRLVDLQYENEKITLDLHDMETKEINRISLDIFDSRFRFVLLNLSDVNDMIHTHSQSKGTIEDLLELDDK